MRLTRARPLLFLLALVLLLSSVPSVLASTQPVGSADEVAMRPPQQGGDSAETDTGTVTAPVDVVPVVPNGSALVSPIYAVDLRNDDFDTLTTANPLATIIAPNTGNYYGGDFANNDFTQLYAVDDLTDTLNRIATATGVVTPVGPMGVPAGAGTWTDLSFDPTTSTMYAMSNSATTGNSVYTVNLTTGLATLIASNNAPGPVVIDGAIHPTTGVYYGVDIIADTLVTIDKTTAALTTIGPTGVAANFAQGMDFEDSTGILYWAAYRGAAVGPGQLRTIDLTTGTSTLIGDITNGVAGETVELDAFAVAASAAGPTPTATIPAPTVTATIPVPTVTATIPAPTVTATIPAPTVTATIPAPTVTATIPAPTVTATMPPTSIELGGFDGGSNGSYAGWLLGLAGLALIAAGMIARRR